MATPTVLMATWRDGLWVSSGGSIRQELAGRPLRSVAAAGPGGAIAVVDGRSIERRAADGAWRAIFAAEVDLACCLPVGDRIFVGTDDARVLAIEAEGRAEWLAGFGAVAGRDTWYAGTAIVDGKVLGPPLGVRSMTATCDGAALLVNVHVGGIPRSTDGGVTWQPTIDVDADAHEVRAHPTRPDLVIAASAVGLCVSRDAGATWTVERDGLHAPHCSAVAFVGDDILVSASTNPFAAEGAIYRRPVDGVGPLLPVSGGLPRWLAGICDTGCITVSGSTVALADATGHLYLSDDAGRTWSRAPSGQGYPMGLAILWE